MIDRSKGPIKLLEGRVTV